MWKFNLRLSRKVRDEKCKSTDENSRSNNFSVTDRTRAGASSADFPGRFSPTSASSSWARDKRLEYTDWWRDALFNLSFGAAEKSYMMTPRRGGLYFRQGGTGGSKRESRTFFLCLPTFLFFLFSCMHPRFPRQCVSLKYVCVSLSLSLPSFRRRKGKLEFLICCSRTPRVRLLSR